VTEAEAVRDDILARAYHEGRKAGQLHLSPSLNPFERDTLEHEQWLKGRDSALIDSLNRRKA
jgi:ribosome modulation factor